MRQRFLQLYKSLSKAKYRKKEGLFLVEGPRAVSQLIQSGKLIFVEVLVTDAYADFDTAHVPCRKISSKEMREVSDSVTPAGVMGIAMIPEEYAAQTIPQITGERILFLEDVQDPGNVGTLLRSAVAFGVAGVILTEGCADVYSPKVVRSTGGALGALWVRRNAVAHDMVKRLQLEGYSLVVADLDGVGKSNVKSSSILALGNEGNGVTKTLRDMADVVVTIPYESELIESLNVAIAGSIVMANMYER